MRLGSDDSARYSLSASPSAGKSTTGVPPMRLYDFGFTFILVAAACAAIAMVIAAQVK